MSRFKDLIDCIDLEEEVRNTAILEYFGREDESEYEIDGETFYVFNKDEVEELLKDSATHDVNSFVNSTSSTGMFARTIECAYVADYIDKEAIVMDIVEEFNYDSLPGYELIDSSRYFYIYKDKDY